MAWTMEQQLAIDLEGGNILVSAGAGSGKTAVLTARVERKLLQGIHIHELLILTFTNAAAAEMKERIRKAIRKNPKLVEEENYLDNAFITTFDSFALSVVKKYHTILNVTNHIQIADDVLIQQEMRKMLDSIMDEYYQNPTPLFSKLIHDFCLKDDKDLLSTLLSIYQKIELKYDKDLYLEHYFDYEMTDFKIASILSDYLQLLVQKQRMIRDCMGQLVNYFDGEFIQKMEDNFHSLLEATTYDEFLKGVEYKSLVVPRGSDLLGKQLKKTIFDLASEIKDLCIYESEEAMREELLSTYDSVSIFVDILREFNKRFNQFKKEHDLYTFTDISRMAIQVVEDNPSVLEELQNQFQEILLDEYQDTSDTQEKFISLISRNNVYMVGDIKQSIYRFRNANPYIFKDKYDDYQNEKNGHKIDLLKNFRSRGEVLDDINLLFDLFMDDDLGGADYQKSHRMVFGNNVYLNEGKTEENHHMDILTYDDTRLQNVSKDEEEAFLIGRDILQKVQSHYPVLDKDSSTLRSCRYQDFVILLDRSRSFDLYKKVFEYLHIPLTVLKEESLKNKEDILVLKNLFQFLICIHQKSYDVVFRYTFTSLARSFLFSMSDEEIYDCFTHNTFFDTSLYMSCQVLACSIDSMPISHYFSYVLEKLCYEEKILTIGSVHSYRVRMEYFYQICCNFEKMGKTIYDFVHYLDLLLEEEDDVKFNVSTSQTDSCKIMTIHKSKGLEYPICYFAGLFSKFNMSDLKERILYDNRYGIIFPKVEEAYKDTIVKTLLKHQIHLEEVSERIRLFYVAVTRAREKIIFVMPQQTEENEVFEIVPLYEREKYQSFLSIMKSIYSVLYPYISSSDFIASKDYLLELSKNDVISSSADSFDFEEFSMDSLEAVENRSFSKHNSSVSFNNDLMKFGTEVHRVLQEISFSDYDLSVYSLSDFVKKKIISFLTSDFILSRIHYPMYKEYEFVWSVHNTLSHGVIDLLIDEGDSFTIVDYKLKNIDDSSYDDQLNGYRKYLEEKMHKKVSCYLYSIFDEEYREVLE